MDQAEEPLKTHQQHPEEGEHHENGASKMFRKVKAKAKKFKNSFTKHGQSHEDDHDVVEEDDEDDELDTEVNSAPGVTGKPESLSHPRETNVPAPEEIVPPGTKVFPVVSSDYTKPIESVPLQDTSNGHEAPAHPVRPTDVSDKEERRETPTHHHHHPLSELSDREVSREAHHEPMNTPVSLLSETEDVTRTFAPSGEDDHLSGQRKVNVETLIKLEDDPSVPGGGLDYLCGVSNNQSKVTDPTKEGSGEAGVPEITESLGRMNVTDESPDQKPGQGFERDLSRRSKEFREFDQDFNSVLGKDSPSKFASESEADMKTESGMDKNSPSRSHEFDLKTEAGIDKNSPMGFGSESGAELGREFDQKIESGRNEYSPESDGGSGAPLGGNFPVRSHELDVKKDFGIDKDSPTGFDGEPDFLAEGRPGYGEETEEKNFPARSDDVKIETELGGRVLPTGTHDQFSPELSRPKERDEFEESRDEFEETRDETTQETKPKTYTEQFASVLGYSGEIPVGDQTQVSGTVDEKLTPVNEKDQETESTVTTKLPLPKGESGVDETTQETKPKTYTEQFASVLGYSGETPVGDQTQVAGTVDEKLTPVNEKDQETESAVTTKLPLSGGESGVEETEQGEEKGVSGRDYLSEKLTPGEEDKALSEVLAEKLQIGKGGEEKKETTSKEVDVTVEKIPTEKISEEEEHGEAVAKEVDGGGGMVGRIKGWFGGGATEEVKPKSPRSVEESSQSSGWFGGGATEEVKPKSPHSAKESSQSSGWFGRTPEEVKPISPEAVEESSQSFGSTAGTREFPNSGGSELGETGVGGGAVPVQKGV